MPLHPQVQAHLERLAGSNFADLHTFAPEQVRHAMRLMTQAAGTGEAVASVCDRIISTRAGELPVRIYHPQPDERRPVIVFFHGGGFVLGDLDTHDGLARALANRTGRVVVSVDYPLAPEHKYPAAINAGFAATQWVGLHGGEIGADGTNIAVAGDSAGGNLAAVVAMMARDAGAPAITHQVLIYPDLDFRRSNVSIQEFAGQYGNISRATQQWFMNHYLNGDHEKLDAHVSPLLAPRLEQLPPAFIVTAEFDALRDEGEQYGARLQQAGVPTTINRYDGMIHEFMRWPFDDAARALEDIAAALPVRH
ncbi:alpha/beta hydrolase [[Mycobacterium] holstebronense]|uniref:Alpha/beta hydrolase n=1 Tax=[Mycobacterium] holstebronense TaxID=3064288 RepID=A0ABM9LZ74_9MYCO|nr:alpha/beta hydrolase [Mycolicibacter sp. MU0102]CAJ1507282.1 alpha/beta hydrolase [Mycolicibacter sp. MU0102]